MCTHDVYKIIDNIIRIISIKKVYCCWLTTVYHPFTKRRNKKLQQLTVKIKIINCTNRIYQVKQTLTVTKSRENYSANLLVTESEICNFE